MWGLGKIWRIMLMCCFIWGESPRRRAVQDSGKCLHAEASGAHNRISGHNAGAAPPRIFAVLRGSGAARHNLCIQISVLRAACPGVEVFCAKAAHFEELFNSSAYAIHGTPCN